MLLEQRGLILAHVLVELRLALAEMIGREPLHVAQHVVEGALRLAAGLAERPEPGNINVRVPGGVDGHIQRRAGFGEAGLQRGGRRLDAGVEGCAERIAGLEYVEGVVQGVEQAVAGGMVGVQILGGIVRGPRQGDEIARRSW